jgi:hypothetical protein
MTCFVVFSPAPSNKQLKVFPYILDSFKDRWRARNKAIDYAQSINSQYTNPETACTIEDIGMSDVGTLIQYSHHKPMES